ncbi:hypothetical protein Tco_1538406 [Tanacetum coccineum]
MDEYGVSVDVALIVTTAPVNAGTPNEVGHESVMEDVPSSYAHKANLHKLDDDVPNDADYDVWLPLASVHECLIFDHSLDDCPKAHKQVVNKTDKGKGASSGANDEGIIEVKKKKSCHNNRGNKNFKPVSVKPKTQYRPKAKQSTEGASQEMTPSVGKKNVSTSGNGTFFLSNSFEALDGENPVIEEVEAGNKASTSGVQEEEQRSTPGGEDEVEPVENDMASYLASKPGVGYGTKSLLEQ